MKSAGKNGHSVGPLHTSGCHPIPMIMASDWTAQTMSKQLGDPITFADQKRVLGKKTERGWGRKLTVCSSRLNMMRVKKPTITKIGLRLR